VEALMTLKERIIVDLKEAMRAVDAPDYKVRLSAIRMLKADIMNTEIAKKSEPSDEDVISLIQRQIKIRNESIEQFEKGGRADLVEKERKEAAVLAEYLPEQMSDDELNQLAQEAIGATGAASPKEMGKVMSYMMPKLKGRADGKRVNQAVSALLKPQQ
jgi:uncharacterized protein YqeY